MTLARVVFVIPGRLPGLNDMIASQGRPWWMGRKVKEDAMSDVMKIMLAYGVPAFKIPVKVHFTWIEKNARRDRDNVMSGGSKIVLDAMKQKGVIIDDSRKWITDITHDTTQLDKLNPRVIVEISEGGIDG